MRIWSDGPTMIQIKFTVNDPLFVQMDVFFQIGKILYKLVGHALLSTNFNTLQSQLQS